jgi:pimeloyl-ACP methyl ester carboxylesterase
MGAGLALLAAGRPDLADRVSVVAAIAPFADLEKLVCLATTGRYSDRGRFAPFEVTELHRQVVAGSLVALLPEGADRDRLLGDVDAGRLPGDLPDLGAAARAVVRVLVNTDPGRFGELYRALPPDVLAVLARLSPVAVCAEIRAPVEIVVPPTDVYFPLSEAHALAHRLPNARLTVTATLDHTRPKASLARLDDLRRFDGFVVRGLAAAA